MPMNEENKTFKPLIVAFCCNWCSYPETTALNILIVLK